MGNFLFIEGLPLDFFNPRSIILFICILQGAIFAALPLYLSIKHYRKYRAWLNENFSDTEKIKFDWLRNFLYIFTYLNRFNTQSDFLSKSRGCWEDTLEYLDYRENKRGKLETYLTITPASDRNSAEVFFTVYDNFGIIIKQTECFIRSVPFFSAKNFLLDFSFKDEFYGRRGLA